MSKFKVFTPEFNKYNDAFAIEKMVDEFYKYKGLDKDGVPKPETLKKQGLKNEPSHMV